MGLCGTAKKHCCWIGGAVCPFLTTSDADGFIWACALRRREGSWAGVYETVEYKSIVRPALTQAGIAADCGDWPGPGGKCNDCGQRG